MSSWKQIALTLTLAIILHSSVASDPSPASAPKASSNLLTELILKNDCFSNYSNLKQISICLKTKLLINLNELIRSNKTIELGSYAYLVKTKSVNDPDNSIDESLNEIPDGERSASDEGEQLTNMIVKKVWQFFMTRSVRLNLDAEDAGVDEQGRKKKEKGGGMMMMAMGMGGMMMQMMMSKVAIIAVKALVIGKIALILSGMIALKKLMSQGGGGGSSHGSSHGSSDWGRRMYVDDSSASDMAFRAYSPTLQK